MDVSNTWKFFWTFLPQRKNRDFWDIFDQKKIPQKCYVYIVKHKKEIKTISNFLWIYIWTMSDSFR